MSQNTNSAQQETVGYWSVLWQNVIKIFFIDLLGATTVLAATSVLVILLFAIARIIWGWRFRPVAESLLILCMIYLLVIVVTAMKRHFSLGLAIKPILSPQREVPHTETTPLTDV